jgi:hypothetical protein
LIAIEAGGLLSGTNSTLAQSMEAVVDGVAARLLINASFSAVSSTVVAQVHRPATAQLAAHGLDVLQNRRLSTGNISILLNSGLFRRYSTSIQGSVSGVWYRNSALFPSTTTVLQDSVFSVRVPGLPDTLDLGIDAVELQMPQPTNLSLETALVCSYWDFKARDWRSQGCRTTIVEAYITCHCRHLTNFAVIVTLRPASDDGIAGGNKSSSDSPTSAADTQRLAVISYLGVVLSCCALFLLEVALLTAWCRLRIYQQLVAVLSPVLITTQLLFVLGAGHASGSDDVSRSCKATAGTLHFLLMLTFALFLCEALELHINFVRVFTDRYNEMNRFRNYIVGSLGFALLIVLVGALGFPEDYGTADYCWLKRDSTASYLL